MLNKIDPADPAVPIGTFNTLVDLGRRMQRDQLKFGKGDGQSTIHIPRGYNGSGSDAPRGAILRFTGGRSIDNRVVVTFSKPITAPQPIYGISLEPIAASKVGRFTIFDPAQLYFYSSDGTPAAGEFWGSEDNQWYARKNKPGFLICGYPTGTGSTARVRAVQTPWHGKAKWIKFTIAGSPLATSDASKSSQTVDDFWQGFDPGATVTLYNMEASSGYIFSGAVGNKGLACYDEIDDKYRIVQMECP